MRNGILILMILIAAAAGIGNSNTPVRNTKNMTITR